MDQTEIAIHEAEDRFRILANCAPVMIWMSGHDGLCTFVNRPWLDFTGRTMEQELGNGWVKGVHEDDVRCCLETYQSAFNARQPFKMEYRLRRADDEYRWILDTGNPCFRSDGTFVGYLGSGMDITERKHIEEAFQREKDFTAHVVTAAPTLICAVAPNGITLFANQGVTRVTGYSSDELLGQNWWQMFYPGHEYGQVEQLFDDFKQKEQLVNYEMTLTTKKGEKRIISWNSVNRLAADGTLLEIVGIGVDITAGKHVENQFQKAHRELERRVDERTAELTKANVCLKQEIFQREQAERTLQRIFEGTTSTVGLAFFRSLVQQLAHALQSQYAFVSEFVENNSRVRTLAFWTSEGFISNLEYNIANTPCETVLNGEICHFSEGVQTRFPRDLDLIKLGVDSYLAIPLAAPSGKILGHLAVMDNVRMTVQPHSLPVLKTFAARATAELQRKSAEEALRVGKDRLESILASAMDAIITVDEEQKVTVFNQAAEVMFRCSSTDALGQPLDRFIPERFRRVHREHIERFAQSNTRTRQMAQLRTVYGVRVDGEEFPLEASISQVEVVGKKLFTVILRDLTERNRAEAEISKLQHTTRYLQEEIKTQHNFEDMVGTSPAIQKVFKQVQSVAPTDTLALITGETGTGKELIARAIHNLSHRKKGMLIKVNCSAIPPGLIESELFGHEKGAFTGALARRIGRFELADEGTLFLDEIGELPLDLQAKLLRVLEDGEFERVGSSRTLKVNVRVIAATNRALAQAVQQGLFRPDLFYRLNHFTLHVPPLRERREDIPLLAKFFVHQYNSKLGKSITEISESVMTSLVGYHWPGNVRELQHVIERAVLMSEGSHLESGEGLPQLGKAPQPFPFPTLEEAEWAHIIKALEATNWRISGERGAAKLLGLKRTTLESKMIKLGIKKNS